MKINKLLFSITAVIALCWDICAYADNLNKDIIVSDAWVQAMPPSQTTTAAYMVITNNAANKAVLVSASSDIAGAVEIHQMSEMDGMMNMAMVSDIHIPALGQVTLKPGGFHIMLINLKKPVNKGDIISIILHFQDGSSLSVNAQARQDHT